MSDVVDADELLRRIRRSRDLAAEEERVWLERAQSLTATDPDRAREATERALTYQVVAGVLTEIIAPGSRPVDAEGTGATGVRHVT
ncbi:hypothetical protein E5082_29890 [Streptomyces griseoluteus]|uniref:Uncharacterized protein n=1 Tax=Streptomyces griseoluteus TaxID=29306 RepID=A0A4Z1D107_STRGP|nr:hypothetical protein [Streptomyces griseoluteus]TGN75142.1 hypothetical protein E5082_29890 [Streptomyces griseoluteus]GHF34081.1 hypothetical protein GCM10017776_60690 [Streptomyces griseoluteus]